MNSEILPYNKTTNNNQEWLEDWRSSDKFQISKINIINKIYKKILKKNKINNLILLIQSTKMKNLFKINYLMTKN